MNLRLGALIRALTLALPLTALLAVVVAQGQGSRPLALAGATVTDGTGRPPLGEAVLVVEGGRLTTVGPAGATPIPGDAVGSHVG
jgi:hypothetical protein